MLPNFRSKQGAFSQTYQTYVKEKERSRGRKGGDRCLLASFKTRPKRVEFFSMILQAFLTALVVNTNEWESE
ncbi:hypothetical protein EV213_102346 [Aureibacillus halotolerans]|uniref:Uncharacterized protein n=1 Tax=Aureibacillus halotolerans TaxID=1508390 RepID=A0A4R6UGP8_9BACI|nr:hypothetical protein EV213_102346 [Aureibacillus halotolerans]